MLKKKLLLTLAWLLCIFEYVGSQSAHRSTLSSPSWYSEVESVDSNEDSPLFAGSGSFMDGDEHASKGTESASSGDIPSEETKENPEDDMHWHKPLFPLDYSDYLGIFLSCAGLIIASGGGIGGGGILVPLYILVLGFTPKYAIPLSNVTVFGGAVVNYFTNITKRHPHADRPLVDWDLILVMEPLTILGALIGSFLNKLLPEIVLTILLVLLLGATTVETTLKGIKVFKKETKEKEAMANEKVSELAKVHKNQTEEVLDAESQSLLGDENELPAISPELQLIYDEEKTVPLFKVGVLWAVFIVVLAINLLKGGGAFPSPIGIMCGTTGYWASTAIMFIWILLITIWCRNYLVKRYHLKKDLGFIYVEGDIQWDESATIWYPIACGVAGLFAGMFGIGGGIVKGPLMLRMGVHPRVSSATSACMIMYTSFTATTSFFVFGLLKLDYALFFTIMGICVTYIGQQGITILIKKLKRDSLIIFSIAAVVGLSTLLMGLHSTIALMYPSHEEEASFCAAGE